MEAQPNIHALRSVREQRRLQIPDVATYTKIAAKKLQAFEEGKFAPSRQQMDRLASAYGVSLYSLFSLSIPNVPSPPTDFRKQTPAPASISTKGTRSLLQSEQIAEFTKQLASQLKYQPQKKLPRIQLTSDVREQAQRFRQSFDEWRHKREDEFGFFGTKESVFVGALRLFFELHGGIVNTNDAPTEDYLGFFLRPDAGLPVIFINRKLASKKAQLFTLVHELCHALLGKEGISNPFLRSNSVERYCNSFAAEFLAPIAEFSKLAESLPAFHRASVGPLVNLVSSQTLLSRHATAVRLLEGQYINRAQYSSWERNFAAKPREEKDDETAGASSGGVSHAKRLGELGHLPVVLAARAVSTRIVDGYDIADGLKLSRALQEKAFALATRRFSIAEA